MLQGVAWHPSGEFALATLLRTKNLVPMTRMVQGWTVTNGLGILWTDGRRRPGAARRAAALLPRPDGRRHHARRPPGLVTSAGTDRVAVVDIARLRRLLEAPRPSERANVLPNHLGKATEFVIGPIPDRHQSARAHDRPRRQDGLRRLRPRRLAHRHRRRRRKTVGRIDLDGPTQITETRRGERLFNSAGIAFHRQLSCHTCHPDGHVDGLTYDIEADGIGLARWTTGRCAASSTPARSSGRARTPPWPGSAVRGSRSTSRGSSRSRRRSSPAVDHYISTIPRPPNRYRPLGRELTAAQRRGKLLFERTATNDGREIHERGAVRLLPLPAPVHRP